MGTSERQLVRALFPWMCRLLSMVVYGGGNFGCRIACLPAPLLDRLLVERMSGDLADSTHQLVHTTALLLLLLGLHSAFQRPSELPLLTFNLGCSLCCACSAVLCSASAACLAAESSFLLRERLRHWTWLVDFGHRIIELFSRHAVCSCHCFSETSEMCFQDWLDLFCLDLFSVATCVRT